MTATSENQVASRGRGAVAVLFTVTIFTSALLLFFVQPLYTRMVLPQIGGAAAVWTTAMLFFQTVLIGGYLYAHLLSKYLAVPVQIAIHVALVVLALLFLPLSVPESWSYDANAPVVTQTLWLYALGVGLPFAVLSANAPLIQTWYRRSGGPSAEDPYFLYAASNLGSLIALLAFPLVAEPLFGMQAISVGWAVGFVALGPMLLLSGLAGRGPEPVAVAAVVETGKRLTPALLGWWAFLAFLPSSLMLSVTSKISTDLGSFPLVWVVPLALYLLTFVLVFSPRSALTAARLRLVFPAVLAVLVFFCLKPTGTLAGFALLLAAFFVASLLAHRAMFESRPDARHLTVFYLTMSVGGALGGIFNSIIAPLAFDRLIELQVSVALTAVLLATQVTKSAPREIGIGIVAGLVALLPMMLKVPDIGPALGASPHSVKVGMVVAVLMAGMLVFYRMRLVGVTATIGLLAFWTSVDRADILTTDRSFFGLHVVADGDEYRSYSNGTTLHGAQVPGSLTPLLYYHPNGSLAQIVNGPRGARAETVGIVGLGVGAMACYARPGQKWHFYEIDQKVVDIALNPDYFTFMSECAADAELHLGDARIVLQGQEALDYDLLVIDAYSSDAVPVHLATVEALELYMARLNPEGLLVFHISNRFYDLEQPLAAGARALGLVGRVQDRTLSDTEGTVGDVPSRVVILARTEAGLGELASDTRWLPLPEPEVALWTDDHADLLSALD